MSCLRAKITLGVHQSMHRLNIKNNRSMADSTLVAMPRRSWLGLLCASLTLWCGCATHYDLTMGNGDVVRARTKPKLQEGYYVFKDLAGRETIVNAMRVRQIEPVRRGSKPKSSF